MCSIVFTLIITVIETSNILPEAFLAVLLLTRGEGTRCACTDADAEEGVV